MEAFSNNKITKLITGTAGIYICFFISGLLHEKMLKTPYMSLSDVADTSLFQYPIIFVLLPSLFAWLVGFSINSFHKRRTYIRQLNLIKIACINTVSTFTFSQAILYADYPLLVLVKSCNILSVVLVGVFCTAVKDKELKLGKDKLVLGSFITLGVVFFYVFEDHDKRATTDNIALGIGLLLISIVADGFMPDFQAEIKQTYKPRPLQMYERINKWVFLISLTYAIFLGHIMPIVEFMRKYPTFILDITSDSLISCIGQMFIYYLVVHFKQHVVPFIISTRKIISGIMSIIVFKHQINRLQWLGLALIVFGAGYEISSGMVIKKWKMFNKRKYTII